MEPEATREGLLILFVCIGLMVAIFISCLLARNYANRAASNPKAILRRIKIELLILRSDMRKQPASKQVHEICAGIDSTLATIDRTAEAIK